MEIRRLQLSGGRSTGGRDCMIQEYHARFEPDGVVLTPNERFQLWERRRHEGDIIVDVEEVSPRVIEDDRIKEVQEGGEPQ